jgi:mRNA interferase RelE/StbE
VPYRIEFTHRAAKELRALDKTTVKRIAARINALADNPRPPSSKLLEATDRLYRIRVGDYRVIYQVEDRTVLVLIVRVGHRREIYR